MRDAGKEGGEAIGQIVRISCVGVRETCRWRGRDGIDYEG